MISARFWTGLGLLAIGLMASSRADAQQTLNCRPDGPQDALCSDERGNQFRAESNPFGETVLTDSHGHKTTVQTDSFGGVTMRRADGTLVRGRAESFNGQTTLRMQDDIQPCKSSAAPGLPKFGAPPLPWPQARKDSNCD